MNQTMHPSPDELSAFTLGQLPPYRAAAVESHISQCPPCCETLLGFSADDTFVALLQAASQLPCDPSGGSTLGRHTGPHSRLVNGVDLPASLSEHPRFEVVSLLGKGGMGDVYKAKHRMMERYVALKIINRGLVRNAEAVDRFHREVKTAARLSHPNIVTAFDAEQLGDVHLLVMEHVDGVDLARMVKDHGPLAIPDACEWVRQAATGLQYAHEQGMVHRDVKPHNLMVAIDGTVKILDFGLATLAPEALTPDHAVEASSDLTVAGSIMGTPDFMAPEQAANARQADIRSDIYSLGATLYYLLSGRAPFFEGSVMTKVQNHAESEPEPIEMVRLDVPVELADVIRRMMAKKAADRFQTPGEVAEALAPLVDRHRATKPSRALAPSKRAWWPPSGPRQLELGCLALLCAITLYAMTDTGTLVIESEDESLAISVRHLDHEARDGNKTVLSWRYRRGDTTTGSTVKTLRRGAYIVFLDGREDEFELSQDRFVLQRGGKVKLKVTRRARGGERPAPEVNVAPEVNFGR